MNQIEELQLKADKYLVINPEILQILTQLDQSSIKLHQAILQSSTNCGCTHLSTSKIATPSEASWQELKAIATGDEVSEICPECLANIKKKLGSMLFYLASLCNALGLDLNDAIDLENKQLDILGYFMLM